MKKTILTTLALCAAFALSAHAQTSTYVTPTYGGGYTVSTPGQMSTYVTPNYGGGYTVSKPGRMSTYIYQTP
jgi:hypothetical protein